MHEEGGEAGGYMKMEKEQEATRRWSWRLYEDGEGAGGAGG